MPNGPLKTRPNPQSMKELQSIIGANLIKKRQERGRDIVMAEREAKERVHSRPPRQ